MAAPFPGLPAFVQLHSQPPLGQAPPILQTQPCETYRETHNPPTMVSLELMRASNSLVATNLPAGLVAVFVGATSGIGETTLRQFAKQAKQPRIYFLGRREQEGKRIEADLEKLNPGGEYHFVQTDVSLMKNVDDACRQLRARESAINLLFLTCGSLITKKRRFQPVFSPLSEWNADISWLFHTRNR